MAKMSKQEKLILGTGAVALAVIAGIGFALSKPKKKPKKKKDYGIKVDPQCNSFTVTSEGKVRDAIRAEVRKQSENSGVDPFQVARAYLKKAAPHCTTYPNDTRNPGEATLFVLTMNNVLDIMREEKLLSPKQEGTFKVMVQNWAIAQGVSPADF